MTSQFCAVSTPLSSEIIQAFVCIQFLVPATAGNKRNALGWLDKEFKGIQKSSFKLFFLHVCASLHTSVNMGQGIDAEVRGLVEMLVPSSHHVGLV